VIARARAVPPKSSRFVEGGHDPLAVGVDGASATRLLQDRETSGSCLQLHEVYGAPKQWVVAGEVEVDDKLFACPVVCTRDE